MTGAARLAEPWIGTGAVDLLYLVPVIVAATLYGLRPGLFASLATGNAVVVKPHPGATLPLAITVKIVREGRASSRIERRKESMSPHRVHRKASPQPRIDMSPCRIRE